jgi:protein TonB
MNSTIQTGSMHEMLFEKRNKDYGAYVIRGSYNDTVLKSLVMVASALLLFIGGTYAYNKFFAKTAIAEEQVKDQGYIETIVNLNPLEQQKTPEVQKHVSPPPAVTTATVISNDAPEDPNKKDLTLAPVSGHGEQNDSSAVAGDPIGDVGGGIPEPPKVEPPVEPVPIAEVMPEFPGGVKALRDFFAKNVVYPERSKIMGSQGTVYVTFVVSKDGKVTNWKVLKGVDDDCNEEAMRVVSKMPVWKPGKNGDKAVPVIFNLPIRFSLN